MKKETQVQRVARHLFRFGSITTHTAVNFPHPITRLAARINDIKNGCIVDIDSELIPWGEAKQAKYSVDQDGRLLLKDCLDAGLL